MVLNSSRHCPAFFMRLLTASKFLPDVFSRNVPPNDTSDSIAGCDTITTLTAEKSQVKIRFNSIDAPERGQPFGTKSKEMLSHIIGKSDVRIKTHVKNATAGRSVMCLRERQTAQPCRTLFDD